MKQPYAAGMLDVQLAERLRRAIVTAPIITMSNKVPKGHPTHVPAPDAEVESLNAQNVYHGTDERLEMLYGEVLEDLYAPVANAFQSPWKALRARSWQTKPGANCGPASWHLDGQARNLLKIMLYSTPTDNGGGGFEININDRTETLRGPAGMWVVFHNSEYEHRGLPPDEGRPNRVATEFTVKAC